MTQNGLVAESESTLIEKPVLFLRTFWSFAFEYSTRRGDGAWRIPPGPRWPVDVLPCGRAGENGSDCHARNFNSPAPVSQPRLDNSRADRYAIAKLAWPGGAGDWHTPHEAALLAFSLAARACLFAPSSWSGIP